MNHINHVLFLVLKTCPNPNSRDIQLRVTSLASRHSSHQGKSQTPFSTFRLQSAIVLRVRIQYVSLLVGLEPSVLSINIIETSSQKPERLSFSKCLQKCSCVHCSLLSKLLLLNLKFHTNFLIFWTIKSSNITINIGSKVGIHYVLTDLCRCCFSTITIILLRGVIHLIFSYLVSQGLNYMGIFT